MFRKRYEQNIKQTERESDQAVLEGVDPDSVEDFDQEKFKTYDQRIRNDVTFLIDNLCRKFGYTKPGAREVCMYVIDNNLAAEFGGNGDG